jgi:hypothetical protein
MMHFANTAIGFAAITAHTQQLNVGSIAGTATRKRRDVIIF